MENQPDNNRKNSLFVFRLHCLFEEAFHFGCHNLDELYQDFLGIYFLKIMSDRFGDLYEELSTFGNDFFEYAPNHMMILIPPGSNWGSIKQKSHNQDIGLFLDHAIETILESNKCLARILPHKYSREEWNKTILSSVIDLIDTLDLRSFDDEYEANLTILQGFEILCSRNLYKSYYNELNKPDYISSVLFQLLNIQKGRIYIPQLRRGELLIDALSYFRENKIPKEELSFIGQETNGCLWAISQLKFLILGVDADICLDFPDFDNVLAQKFNYIIADAANFDFDSKRIENLLNSLAENGKLVLIANQRLLISNRNNKLIHKTIVNEDFLDSVIALPPHEAGRTKTSLYLVLIDKKKNAPGFVKFIDATHLGYILFKSEIGLSKEDTMKVISVYQNQSKDSNFEKIHCYSKTNKEIIDEEINLIPDSF